MYVKCELSKVLVRSRHNLSETLSWVFTFERQDNEVTGRCFLQERTFMYTSVLSGFVNSSLSWRFIHAIYHLSPLIFLTWEYRNTH